MPTKIIVDTVQSVTAGPLVSGKQNTLPTIADLSLMKVHPTSKVNKIGILILYSLMSFEALRTMEQQIPISVRSTLRISMIPVVSVSSHHEIGTVSKPL